MATIYRAPEKTPEQEINLLSIFLAGSIDMGQAEEWQPMIEEALKDEKVIIFNPRRLDFDKDAEYSSTNPYIVEQVQWELAHLDEADIIVFYFDPKGKAPITLYEMGRVSSEVKKKKKKAIIYCPDGYWKKANVVINGQYDGFDFAETKEILLLKLKMML